MVTGWAPGKLDKRLAALLVAALVVTSVSAGLWPGADRGSVADARTVRYVYDDVGRLLAVSDPSTDTAVYRYDPGGNMVAIERRPSAELSVIGVSPVEAAPGEEVTVHATGLDADPGGNVVRFGDARAEVVGDGHGSLLVQVPAEARSGPVTVAVGEAAAASPRHFTVASRELPRITSVSPEVVAAGGELRVAGENFTGDPLLDMVVIDGSTYGTVTSASTTELVVTVPAPAPSGPVSVVTPNGTSQPWGDLAVVPAGVAPAEVADVARVEAGEELVVELGPDHRAQVALVDAEAGEEITLDRRTEPGDLSSCHMSIGLRSPDGRTLVEAPRSEVDRCLAFDRPVLATASGTHTVVLVAAEESEGTVAITFGVGPAVAAEYDAANRLVRWGDLELSYDAAGNLVSDGERRYRWDARGQLVAVEGPVPAELGYDAFGRRTQVLVDAGTTRYRYDGANVVATSGPGGDHRYLTGLSVDQVFARTGADGTTSYLVDGLGSTVALVGEGASLAARYARDPFGNHAGEAPAGANPFGFTGREQDPTGLSYHRARYYDPRTARFISEDPIGFAGGDLNLYAYVGNDPLNAVDPSGLCLKDALPLFLKAFDLSDEYAEVMQRFNRGEISFDELQAATDDLLRQAETSMNDFYVSCGAAAVVVLATTAAVVLPGIAAALGTRAKGLFARGGLQAFGACGPRNPPGTGTTPFTARVAHPGGGAPRATLYRAVSSAEADDIARIGGFRAGPNSYEGKLFATTADDAARYGRINEALTPGACRSTSSRLESRRRWPTPSSA